MASIMYLVTAALCGAIFALGLVVAGMTQPQNILNFIDLLGNWDWRLLLVMCGGIAVNAIIYWLVVRKRNKPLLAANFSWPSRTGVDARLISGAVVFGAGWALAGFCPGPALVSFASANLQPVVFVFAMFVGMWVFRLVDKR